MNTDIVEVINQARFAQKHNHMLTPDEIGMDVISLAAINYNDHLGGFVAQKNTYRFKKNLRKAGFIWLSAEKAWFKPINKTTEYNKNKKQRRINQ